MTREEAHGLFSAAVAEGRADGGWIVSGDLRGECDLFARGVLSLLFPGCDAQVEAGNHPDVFAVRPEGRSRTIKIDAMRGSVVEPLGRASFSGGWRAVVIEGADRMQPGAANTFLKTLEEPPPKTVFLLLTDSPEDIMPTIVSRCRRLRLPMSRGLLSGGDLEEIEASFPLSSGAGPFDKGVAAKSLAALLERLEDDAVKDDRSEDAPLARKMFFRTILSHAAKWMEDGSLPRWRAFRNIEAVEAAYAQCNAYLGREAVLSLMLDRMVFP